MKQDVDVRSAEPGDRDAAVGVMTLAFANDPFMRWMFPQPGAYLEHFPRFLSMVAGPSLDEGGTHVAGAFRGVAIWLPPGVEADPERSAGIFQEVFPGERLSEIGPVFGRLADAHPKTPHWYLPSIGVDPSWQGTGVGSALLRHAVGRCDQDDLIAYLESSNPKNVPLYERYGFEVTGEIRYEDGSPPLVPMLREPR